LEESRVLLASIPTVASVASAHPGLSKSLELFPVDQNRFDVIVVGAGPAGITAATALGRSGFSVLVCEAAVYPGAENWSGCVYFTENLEADEAFGRAAIEAGPVERRLVERGFYLYNGHSLLGAALCAPDAFRSCYTVLRPVFDRYLAELSREQGVVLMNETTVQSLIRHAGRVIGVHTERGPAYADVVYLAEGDASHLVTQEGYERVGKDAAEDGAPEAGPHFLQGIKEVISLSPEAVEERFCLPAGGGGAYELLLRNGSRNGKTVRLNMGSFIYTNRDSISIGLVLPVDNLAQNFDGDHNLLMEWFKGLPEVARWIEGGEVTSYGTKLIRSGGLREIPRLVDDGLAIGGAASGIGIDFPYPNFTGPATSMGLLFARAIHSIAAENGGPGNGAAKGGVGASPFTAAALERAYLKPVRQTHYYRNVEHLADWPGYIERTQYFFDRQVDAINGAAYILSRPDMSSARRYWEVLRLKRRVIGTKRMGALVRDMREQTRALDLGKAVWSSIGIATVGRWLVNTVTALIPGGQTSIDCDDATGVAEATGPDGARVRIVHRVLAGEEPVGRLPWLACWYWKRFGPALAGAFSDVYTNDDEPLDSKLPRALGRLIGRLSIWDVLFDIFNLVVGGTAWAAQAAIEWFQVKVMGKDPASFSEQFVSRMLLENRDRIRLDDNAVKTTTTYEHKLGTIRYIEGEHSHIKVMWPDGISARNEILKSPLWSVCPARVYEVQANKTGMPGIVVNFDNCLKCETCWRATDDVHWSRATQQRLVYEVYTPTHGQLRDYLLLRPEPTPRLRQLPAYWDALWEGSPTGHADASERAILAAVRAELGRFKAALGGYSRALGSSPLVLEQGERTHLDELLDVATRRFASAHGLWRSSVLTALRERLGADVATLWEDAAGRIDDLAKHAARQRYFWADIVGKQLAEHHVAGICRLLDTLGVDADAALDVPTDTLVPTSPQGAWAWANAWRLAEQRPADLEAVRREIGDWCEQNLDSVALRSLEEQDPPSAALREWMAAQLAAAVEAGRQDLSAGEGDAGLATATYGRRDVLLEELAAVDPSLSVLAAQHLLACDLLAGAAAGSIGADLEAGRAFATVVAQGSFDNQPVTPAAAVEESEPASVGSDIELHGEAPLVATALASWLLVVRDNHGYLVPVDDPGVRVEPVGCIGLAGAGVRRVVFDNCAVLAERVFEIPALEAGSAFVEPAAGEPFADLLRIGVPDHLAIVRGAAAYLTMRGRENASARVQFPGAFQDEDGRDTIGKFGAVKQMLGQMEAQRILVESLSVIDPADDPWIGAAVRKILAAEAFGPGEDSLSYNCGQIYGGTAFSEDDCIAKYYRDGSPFRFLLAHDDALRAEIGRRRLDAVRSGGSLIPVSAAEAVWFDALRDEGPLAAVLPRWEASCAEIEAWAAEAAAGTDDGVAGLSELVAHQAGEAVTRALGVKACILRAAWRIECGAPSEATLESTSLFNDRLAAAVPALIEGTGLLADVLEVGRTATQFGDLEPSVRIGDAESYEVMTAPENAGQSGGWLVAPFDAARLRYIPEILWNDAELRPFRERLEAEQRRRFKDQRFDGLTYGRYLEKLHIVPDVDLDYMIDNGYFRMTIPTEFGGEGALKAMYYIVCEMFSRYGDAALALAIMGNTSIGTTPMMIGLYQDLPRARGELEKVKADESILGDIRSGLDDLIAGLESPDFEALQAGYVELSGIVKKRVVKSAVLKHAAGGFLRPFFGAGKAGLNKDMEGFGAKLREAREAMDGILDGVDERLAEYPRRQRAHELSLKMIAAGYISAFALSEPTAGSDTAGVKTTARLDRREVHADEDGVLYFWLDEENRAERRNILDSSRVEFGFAGKRMFYRYSHTAEPSAIRHDEYDYEKDLPGHWRTYMHDGHKVEFTDIAEIREDEDGRRWFDYWELNGAKQWITNGRFAHCFALYARTQPEGVTGFFVDRHLEGFVVGSDEEKLGQRGSPTNELSLTGVRVPRECIIGFRGRGQVNALETLNTGRTGIAVTSRATIQEMMDDAVEYLGGDRGGDTPSSPYPVQKTVVTPLQSYWMGRLTEELMSTIGISSELIGLFDQQAKDIRMESAIGKYFCSEAQHDGIDLMERLRGLDGQTHRHRVEKTRRDARVLTIYEGTNEIQRYLLLRDLAQRMLPVWRAAKDASGADGTESATDDAVRSAYPELCKQLEETKERLMLRLDEADQSLGILTWANVSLQSCFFRLVEIAGLIKAMDSVLFRLEWLAAHEVPDEYAGRLERAAKLAFQRCRLEIDTLDRRFTSSYAYLQDGRYPPDVRLGFMSLDPEGALAEAWGAVPEALRPAPAERPLEREVRVAVMMKPVPAIAPRPRLGADAFEESLYTIDQVDLRALEMALALKRRDPQRVTLAVYTLAGAPGTEILRQAAALGADEVVLLETPPSTPVLQDPAAVARVIAKSLAERPADIVFCGAGASDTSQGIVAPTLAGLLEHQHVDRVLSADWTDADAPGLRVTAVGWQGHELDLPLPCVVAVEPGSERVELPFGMQGFLRGLSVGLIHQEIDARMLESNVMSVSHSMRTAAGDGAGGATARTPEEAAAVLLDVAGLNEASAEIEFEPYAGDPRGFGQQPDDASASCLFLCEPATVDEIEPATMAALASARNLASTAGLPLDVILPVADNPAVAAGVGRIVAEVAPRRIYLIKHAAIGTFGWRGHLEWLHEFWGMYRGEAKWLLGPEWASTLFARFVGQGPPAVKRCWPWFHVESISNGGGSLRLRTEIFDGAGQAIAEPPAEGLRLVTFAKGAEVGVVGGDAAEPALDVAEEGTQVFAYEPQIDYDPAGDAVAALMNRLGGAELTLRDAEYVVDVGYGIAGREGLEMLAEPLLALLIDELGLDKSMIGATRKVTQDLEILPDELQIGQTGVRVSPKLMLALAVSGAPQHIDWVGDNTVVISFNTDPDAPLMRLNDQKSTPVVHPIAGDIKDTIPRFIEALREAIDKRE